MTEKVHDGIVSNEKKIAFTLKQELCDECEISRETALVFYSIAAGEELAGEKCLSHMYTTTIRPRAAFGGFYLPVTPYFLRYVDCTVLLTIGLRLSEYPDMHQETSIRNLLNRLGVSAYKIHEPHRWDSATEWEIPVSDAIMQLFMESKIEVVE